MRPTANGSERGAVREVRRGILEAARTLPLAELPELAGAIAEAGTLIEIRIRTGASPPQPAPPEPARVKDLLPAPPPLPAGPPAPQVVRPPYLTGRELRERLKVSRTTLWSWMRAGSFPRPVSFGAGGRTVRWRTEDVQLWEDRRRHP